MNSNVSIFEEYKEQVRRASSIIKVLESYGIKLNNLNGLCPLHNDKNTPSLYVYPKTESFYCFGCHVGGDVFEFVMRMESISFTEAVDKLAEAVGIKSPNISYEERKQLEEHHQERKALQKLYNAAADIYHDQLTDEHYKLLQDKWGLSAETAKEFKFGFAPANGKFIGAELEKRGFDRDLIYQSGLLNKGRYDHFQGRLIFPYWKHGQVMYFIGRHTDETPAVEWEKAKFKKLLTHSENNSHVSDVVSNEYFAGEDTVRGAEELLITEGIADCYAAIQAGFSCISPATTTFRQQDFPRLATLTKRAKVVYIINDNEENGSGEKGAIATAEYLEEQGIKVCLVKLPKPDEIEKVDLADFLRANSASDLRRLMVEAKTLFEIKLGELGEVKENEKLAFARENIIPLITRKTGMERDLAADKLFKALKPLGVKRRNFDAEIAQAEVRQIAEDSAEKPTQEEMTEEEKAAALELLKRPDILDLFIKATEDLGHTGDNIIKKTLYLSMTSRNLDKPINNIVKGSSASGKSFTTEKCASFMPPEDVLAFTEVSPKALYHRKDSMQHKILIIFERHGSEQADYSIRSLQSEGKLVFSYPVKNEETGKFEALDIEVTGPIACVETTTKAAIHDENQTRVFDLYIDESEEQTKKILEVERKRAKGELAGKVDSDRILKPWQNTQRLTRPYSIIIPYVDVIKFPTKPLRVRRDFQRFLALIEASALLHQYQRKITVKNDCEFLTATLDDYSIAYEIANKVLRQTLTELTPTSERILEAAWEIAEKAKEEQGIATDAIWITRRQLMQKVEKSEKTVRDHIKPLVNQGYLEEEASPGKATKYKVCRKLESIGLSIPTPEEIKAALEVGNPGSTLVNANYQGENADLPTQTADPGKVGNGEQEGQKNEFQDGKETASFISLPGLPGYSKTPAQGENEPWKTAFTNPIPRLPRSEEEDMEVLA